MSGRTLIAFVAFACLLGLAGCETVEKPADSMLPQSQPTGWQGGIPGVSTPGSGYRR
ncbi:MAG: hypothetical protein RLZ85_231 [Verrucomicrobiota bacterium]|jgi:hypothetical protein